MIFKMAVIGHLEFSKFLTFVVVIRGCDCTKSVQNFAQMGQSVKNLFSLWHSSAMLNESCHCCHSDSVLQIALLKWQCEMFWIFKKWYFIFHSVSLWSDSVFKIMFKNRTVSWASYGQTLLFSVEAVWHLGFKYIILISVQILLVSLIHVGLQKFCQMCDYLLKCGDITIFKMAAVCHFKYSKLHTFFHIVIIWFESTFCELSCK